MLVFEIAMMSVPDLLLLDELSLGHAPMLVAEFLSGNPKNCR